MTETGFKFSHLDEETRGSENKESKTAGIRSPVDPSTNSNTMMRMALTDDPRLAGKAVWRTTLLLMVFIGMICLLSIVLSGVALSRVTAVQSSSSERIWTFALGESYFNMHYIDDQTQELDGFDVEMVEAVCEVAGKRCEIVADDYANCWYSPKSSPARGGEGLNGGWYDACVGWQQTPERLRAFTFTEPYTKPLPSAFFIAEGTSFDYSNMAGKRIGFLEGYSLSNEHCLNRQDIMGLPLNDDQVINYATLDDADNALMNKSIDALFTIKYLSMNNSAPITTRLFDCSTNGSSVMSRKDSLLADWWDPAWESLWASKTYHTLCETLEVRHGPFPGLDPDEICLHMTT